MLLRLETCQTAETLPHIAAEYSGLEDVLFDAFIEDAYDGLLHLVTLTDIDTGRLAGLIFWQALEQEEVDNWTSDWRSIHAQLHPAPIEAHRKQLLPVRKYPKSMPVDLTSDQASSPDNIRPNRWLKIDLLCTDRSFRGRGVGKVLLTSALVYSAVREGKNSAMLEVAGGEENVAATGLYSKFGFQTPPEGFMKPPGMSVAGSRG